MTPDAREDHFDTGGHVARARRVADLSQRELADAVGVNQTTVARWENGSRPMTVTALSQVLGLAGLRLAVVDENDQFVSPVPFDAVRDNAGRRFPAHLDVVAPEGWPSNRGAGPRYDRADPKGWYALRSTGDPSTRDRSMPGTPATRRPADHPTVGQLAERRADRRSRRVPLRGAEPECRCEDACFQEPVCVEACRCRCETSWTGL